MSSRRVARRREALALHLSGNNQSVGTSRNYTAPLLLSGNNRSV
jgi:hypothetical protein